MPAIDAALAKARTSIQAITANPEPPDFDNTLTALEAADEWLDRISSVFYHLLHVDADDAIQALAKEIPPKLSAFRNDVILDRDLFARIEAVEARKEDLQLDPEQATVLENHLQSFRRNGDSFNEEDQHTPVRTVHRQTRGQRGGSAR
jgi:peptidyl-dipeptidase Dcp